MSNTALARTHIRHNAEMTRPGGKTDDRRWNRKVCQIVRQPVSGVGGAAQSRLPPTLKLNMKTTFDATGWELTASVVRKNTYDRLFMPVGAVY